MASLRVAQIMRTYEHTREHFPSGVADASIIFDANAISSQWRTVPRRRRFEGAAPFIILIRVGNAPHEAGGRAEHD